jgi:hypothetical protein
MIVCDLHMYQQIQVSTKNMIKEYIYYFYL